MNNIKKLRLEKKKTLKEVAEAVGLSESQLSFYENGKRKPRSNDVWKRLANYFGVSTSYIMGLSPSNNNPNRKKNLILALNTIAKERYDFDISNDKDTIHYLLNRIDLVSDEESDIDETELYSENKDLFDDLFRFPNDWDSEGFIQFTITELYDLKRKLQSFYSSTSEQFDSETQLDIANTLSQIDNILSNAREEISKIPINEKYTSMARLQKEIKENANKEVLDPPPMNNIEKN